MGTGTGTDAGTVLSPLRPALGGEDVRFRSLSEVFRRAVDANLWSHGDGRGWRLVSITITVATTCMSVSESAHTRMEHSLSWWLYIHTFLRDHLPQSVDVS